MRVWRINDESRGKTLDCHRKDWQRTQPMPNQLPSNGPPPDAKSPRISPLTGSPEASLPAADAATRLEIADLLVLDDQSPYRLAEVGELHRRQGRLREAEICLRKVAELIVALGHGPLSQCHAFRGLGSLLVEAGKPGEAEEWLRRAAQIVNDPNAGANLSTCYSVNADLAEALVAQGKNEEAAPVLTEARTRREEFLRVVTGEQIQE
jgi:tetratricopeptide (TPR) repeat protein